MFTELFLRLTRSTILPHRLHLLASVLAPHLVIVERVPMPTPLRRLSRPNHHFRRVRERPTSKIRRRIRLLPYDVVQKTIPVLHQSHAHTRIDMQSASHPDRPARLQNALTLTSPRQVELMIRIDPVALIPITLVDTHHPTRRTRDPIIRKLVWRIRPDAIDAIRRNLRENLQSIPQIQRCPIIPRSPPRHRYRTD